MTPHYLEQPVQMMQWTGDNYDELVAFFGGERHFQRYSTVNQTLECWTFAGPVYAQLGDYLVLTNETSCTYPVDHKIAETYTPVPLTNNDEQSESTDQQTDA